MAATETLDRLARRAEQSEFPGNRTKRSGLWAGRSRSTGRSPGSGWTAATLAAVLTLVLLPARRSEAALRPLGAGFLLADA